MESSDTMLKGNFRDNGIRSWGARYLQVVFCTLDIPIQVLSIDTLVQEAIQAFNDGEKSSKAPSMHEDVKGDPEVDQKEMIIPQASVTPVFRSWYTTAMDQDRMPTFIW